jgi:hypothetical protein
MYFFNYFFFKLSRDMIFKTNLHFLDCNSLYTWQTSLEILFAFKIDQFWIYFSLTYLTIITCFLFYSSIFLLVVNSFYSFIIYWSDLKLIVFFSLENLSDIVNNLKRFILAKNIFKGHLFGGYNFKVFE